MITIAILKFLEDNGIGTIGENLFWQNFDTDDYGLYIVNIGQAQARGSRRVQRYELYARSQNDDKLGSLKLLERVIELINNSYNVCTLPGIPEEGVPDYENVTLMPLSTPTRVGIDTNGRVIWSTAGNIIY